MYPQVILTGAIVRTSSNFDTAEVLTAAAAAYGNYQTHYPFTVQRFTFHISTTVDDLTASVIRLEKISVANVTSSIATMTIPDGAVANKVYGVDCSPVTVGVGERLQFNHLTQGALGGTPAGAGFYGFYATMDPEVMGNQTNYITA